MHLDKAAPFLWTKASPTGEGVRKYENTLMAKISKWSQVDTDVHLGHMTQKEGEHDLHWTPALSTFVCVQGPSEGWRQVQRGSRYWPNIWWQSHRFWDLSDPHVFQLLQSRTVWTSCQEPPRFVLTCKYNICNLQLVHSCTFSGMIFPL